MSKTINVVVVKKTDGIITSDHNVTLKNVPTVVNGNTVSRLDSLVDVVATSEANGAVPVYDSSIDRYVVKPLDLSDITGVLDGGSF